MLEKNYYVSSQLIIMLCCVTLCHVISDFVALKEGQRQDEIVLSILVCLLFFLLLCRSLVLSSILSQESTFSYRAPFALCAKVVPITMSSSSMSPSDLDIAYVGTCTIL